MPGSTESYVLTPPPHRAQIEEMDDRFEKFNQAMSAWTIQFEKRMCDLIAAKVGPTPAPGLGAATEERTLGGAKGMDPWAQARAAASAPQAPAPEASAQQASAPEAAALAGTPEPWPSAGVAPLHPIHPKDINKPEK